MTVAQLAVLCGINLYLAWTSYAGHPTVVVPTGIRIIKNATIIGRTVRQSSVEVDQYLGLPYATDVRYFERYLSPSTQNSLPHSEEYVHHPKACPQYTTSPFPWYRDSTGPNEQNDACLFMNMWVPQNDRHEKQAVLVFIHGGEHRFGSISDEIYNGTRIAALGGIIVITVQYRLGFFSYYYSNLRQTHGNLALEDILKALSFIKKYIGYFGGDKDRITIAGQGSGATDVAYLSLHPQVKDLFARQIMQSPLSLLRNNGKEQNSMYSQQFANLLGCANDSYPIAEHGEEVFTCLNYRTMEVTRKAEYELLPLRSSPLLVPQWDPSRYSFWKIGFREAVKTGNFLCNNLLIGVNQDEGSFMLTAYEYRDLFGFFGEKDFQLNRTLAVDMIRKVATVEELSDPDSVAKHYVPEDLTDDTDHKIRDQVVKAFGDITFVCPAVYLADKCQEKNKKTFFYLFDHRPAKSPWAKWMGVTNYDEVKFVFGQPVLEQTRRQGAREAYLSVEMIQEWAQFVKTGWPKTGWNSYDKKTRPYKIFNPTNVQQDINGQNGPHSENCEFLKPMFGL